MGEVKVEIGDPLWFAWPEKEEEPNGPPIVYPCVVTKIDGSTAYGKLSVHLRWYSSEKNKIDVKDDDVTLDRKLQVTDQDVVGATKLSVAQQKMTKVGMWAYRTSPCGDPATGVRHATATLYPFKVSTHALQGDAKRVRTAPDPAPPAGPSAPTAQPTVVDLLMDVNELRAKLLAVTETMHAEKTRADKNDAINKALTGQLVTLRDEKLAHLESKAYKQVQAHALRIGKPPKVGVCFHSSNETVNKACKGDGRTAAHRIPPEIVYKLSRFGNMAAKVAMDAKAAGKADNASDDDGTDDEDQATFNFADIFNGAINKTSKRKSASKGLQAYNVCKPCCKTYYTASCDYCMITNPASHEFNCSLCLKVTTTGKQGKEGTLCGVCRTTRNMSGEAEKNGVATWLEGLLGGFAAILNPDGVASLTYSYQDNEMDALVTVTNLDGSKRAAVCIEIDADCHRDSDVAKERERTFKRMKCLMEMDVQQSLLIRLNPGPTKVKVALNQFEADNEDGSEVAESSAAGARRRSGAGPSAGKTALCELSANYKSIVVRECIFALLTRPKAFPKCSVLYVAYDADHAFPNQLFHGERNGLWGITSVPFRLEDGCDWGDWADWACFSGGPTLMEHCQYMGRVSEFATNNLKRVRVCDVLGTTQVPNVLDAIEAAEKRAAK